MQNAATTIVRDNISDAVEVALRNMIVDGRLPAGERINEVHLARELGVSRTPLREGLARLAHEGALRSIPHFGYYVRELTLGEFEQIYAIRPLLDPEALRLAGLPSRERLERLRRINDQIEEAAGKQYDPTSVIALDDEWHLELIAECRNAVLIDLIGEFIQRTRRYEIALMREQRNVAVATANHKAIMAALRRRDLEAACVALRVNLQSGQAPVVAWLKARESTKGVQR